MALPAELRTKFTIIIDAILDKSDLTTISEKRIRKGIQDAVEYDITPQKGAIKELIMERFDIFNAKQNGDTDPVPSVEEADPLPTTNGHSKSYTKSSSEAETPGKREADSDGFSAVMESAPPKKKRKTSVVDEDAAYAAKLQAEEDKLARPRRAGAPKKAAVPKKKKGLKKKTSARITGSDDSEVDEDAGPTRKVNRDTGFHKPLNLSPQLAELFGETSMSRPQVTKRIWEYIKSRQLQDPSDRRFILCDDKLQEFFKQDKVHMFTMTKLLNQHMYNPDE